MSCPKCDKPYVETDKIFWCTDCGRVVEKYTPDGYKNISPTQMIVEKVWRDNPHLRNDYEMMRKLAEREYKRSFKAQEHGAGSIGRLIKRKMLKSENK